jgi:rhamnogalacturonyl hydrolase YesR
MNRLRHPLLASVLALTVAATSRGVAQQAAPAAKPPSTAASTTTQDYFSNWPKGLSPKEIGKAVAEHFVTSPHQNPKLLFYPEVCAWYGSLTFAKVTNDAALKDKLVARFQPLMDERESALLPEQGKHVDLSVFGTVPLELYQQTGEEKYLTLGKSYADRQWDKPDAAGLSDQTRFWVDDMYMITILQVQAYRATHDIKYLDRASLEAEAYLDKLQQPNGLFFHAPDVKYFWGRGDGWFAAGMTELLRELPANHPRRARILAGYRLMMAGLLKYQAKDGTWRELIDHDEAWPESSGSGMFTFALVSGVRNGWLDAATYGPAARRAWLGLAGYVDQHADVTSVCEGTGKQDSLEYYLLRRRKTGDFHGQAPVLWAATALLR